MITVPFATMAMLPTLQLLSPLGMLSPRRAPQPQAGDGTKTLVKTGHQDMYLKFYLVCCMFVDVFFF